MMVIHRAFSASAHLSGQLCVQAAGLTTRQIARGMSWRVGGMRPSAGHSSSNGGKMAPKRPRGYDSNGSGSNRATDRSRDHDGSNTNPKFQGQQHGSPSFRRNNSQGWQIPASSSLREKPLGGSRNSRRGQPQQQQRRSAAAQGSDSSNWDDSSYEGDEWDGSRVYQYPARPSKASYRDELFGEPLYGVAPILTALKAGVRTPHVLLLQEGLTPAARKDTRALQEIQQLAAERGAAVRWVSKHELNMLSGNRPHQGLILDASPLEWHHLDVLPLPEGARQQQQQQVGIAGAAGEAEQQEQQGSNYPVWLALDEVVDPQNLGAMLRSAYCLGASGVLGCSRNCAPLTPVVSKASAGAAELMTLYSCRSMPRTLADAADKGWAVLGAAAEQGAVPISQYSVDRPTILVMGNEGYGLRTTVRRCCSQLVQIEMTPGATGSNQQSEQLVDSLNVSVATGIVLHHLLTAAKQE